jgi:hypothetical protein
MDVLKEFFQYAVIIPLGYVWSTVASLRNDFNEYKAHTYTKEETKEMISLRLEVVETKLSNIHEDISYIKRKLEDK